MRVLRGVAPLLGIASLSLSSTAQALPFKPDCRSMARYAAAIANRESGAAVKYTFDGFGGPLSRRDGFTDLFCEDGFIIQMSPKGTLVCNGYIHYTEGDGMIRWSGGSVDDLIREIKESRRASERAQEDLDLELKLQAGGSTYDRAALEQAKVLRDITRQFEDDVSRAERSATIAPCRWR